MNVENSILFLARSFKDILMVSSMHFGADIMQR